MLKIAIDCHKLEDKTGAERAGIGRHTYRLLEEITKRDDLKDRFIFYLYFKGHIPKDIDFLENKIFCKKIAKLPLFLPFFRPSFNIFFHIALPMYAFKDKIDVTFFPSFMLPAFFLTKSLVVLTNDIYYEYTKGNLPLRYRMGYKLFANWASRRATQITTQTNASRNEISEYFKIKKEKIAVIPLGADFENITLEPVDKENYIFYLGQAFPRRHLKETIQAFELIAPDFPDIYFIAVGVDKYNPPIILDLVKEVNQRLGSPRIIRQEFVSDKALVDLYKKAQLFVYISSSEAMGLPPLEALASSTVPVVADTPTTREIFEEKAFFVKSPYNPKEIAKVLTQVLKNPEASAKVIEGKEKIISKYTWRKHANLMIELFEKISQK